MILIPYGPGFLQMTPEEYGTVLGRGLAPGPIAAPAHSGMAERQPERWITSQELAALTGVGDTTLEGWARQGVIPCIRAGKALRFKLTEVEVALRHADRRIATHAEGSERTRESLGRNQRTTNGTRRPP